MPDYVIKEGTTYRIIADHLGSPRLIVNTQTGNIAQRLNYDEFGNITTDTHPGFQPFGFAGGLYDRDTKLVRFGARDYDPVAGWWTPKDRPPFNHLDLNVYVYAHNDPINHFDPLGEATLPGALPGIVQAVCNVYATVAEVANSLHESYDQSVGVNEDATADVYGNQHAAAVEGCIAQYQAHQNNCMLNDCIDRASNEHLSNLRNQWQRSQQERAANPWPDMPAPSYCPKVSVPGRRGG